MAESFPTEEKIADRYHGEYGRRLEQRIHERIDKLGYDFAKIEVREWDRLVHHQAAHDRLKQPPKKITEYERLKLYESQHLNPYHEKMDLKEAFDRLEGYSNTVASDDSRPMDQPDAAIAATPQVDEQESGQESQPDEHGYVKSPLDMSAYVPVKDIMNKHTPDDHPLYHLSAKKHTSILENYKAHQVRWTRPLTKGGQPNKHRRSVHLSDWISCLERNKKSAVDADGFLNHDPEEIERRTKMIKENRVSGK